MSDRNEKDRRAVIGGLTAGVAIGAITPLFARQNSTPQIQSPGLYVKETPAAPHAIAAPETSAALFVDRFGAIGVKTVTSAAELQTVSGALTTANSAAVEAVKLFFLNGGKKAVLASVRLASARSLLNDRRGGLNKLLNGPTLGVDFVCVPAAGLLRAPDAASVYQAALALAQKNKALLFLDAPSIANSNAVSMLTQWKAALNIDSKDAALYAPRLVPTGGSAATLPASAAAAGVAARIDATRGVWKAPAGTEASVIGGAPEAAFSNGDNEVLNQAGINPIRDFAGAGAVVWGARTMSSDPEWKYVPVRRTALYIEKAFDKGLEWAVFEPNAEPLWAQLRNSINDFLTNLWRQGALQGAKPEHAFFVRCDRSTTTQADIDRGVCNIVVGFAPLKPAEFIILQREQRTAG